ncbi:hypothetical protein D9758_017710 [Tetrapyrgos nigripes]|uniref:Uncharacterized protein n=1 Tax=Tetrapyrgos nigripes TaxID=182062 RepID=A0A8H5C7Z7_9AGAR|nr:hypothetical protein D9758_017710 [Tetrapyrgos nigripes]
MLFGYSFLYTFTFTYINPVLTPGSPSQLLCHWDQVILAGTTATMSGRYAAPSLISDSSVSASPPLSPLPCFVHFVSALYYYYAV